MTVGVGAFVGVGVGVSAGAARVGVGVARGSATANGLGELVDASGVVRSDRRSLRPGFTTTARIPSPTMTAINFCMADNRCQRLPELGCGGGGGGCGVDG